MGEKTREKNWMEKNKQRKKNAKNSRKTFATRSDPPKSNFEHPNNSEIWRQSTMEQKKKIKKKKNTREIKWREKYFLFAECVSFTTAFTQSIFVSHFIL